jgi:hypothetical protein
MYAQGQNIWKINNSKKLWEEEHQRAKTEYKGNNKITEQSSKGKGKTHKSTHRQDQSTIASIG